MLVNNGHLAGHNNFGIIALETSILFVELNRMLQQEGGFANYTEMELMDGEFGAGVCDVHR